MAKRAWLWFVGSAAATVLTLRALTKSDPSTSVPEHLDLVACYQYKGHEVCVYGDRTRLTEGRPFPYVYSVDGRLDEKSQFGADAEDASRRAREHIDEFFPGAA